MTDQVNPGRMYYINEIDQQLGRLVSWVEIANRNNRSDVSLISENILCGLLNLMYGWNLTNANTPTHPNFPGVDLVDDKACVAVQITAQNTLDKVKGMLEKFFQHKLDERFSRLILMEITNQEPTQSMRDKKEGCFYGKRDIWNIPRLVRELQNEDIDKLKEITEYLDQEIGSLYTRPRVVQEEPPKEEPTKEEPPKEDPPKEEPPKEEPSKKDPPKRKIKKTDPPKEEPPKAEDESDGEEIIEEEDEFEEEEEIEEDIPKKDPLSKVIAEKLQTWKQVIRAKLKRKPKKKRKKSAGKKKWLLALIPVFVLICIFFLIPDEPQKASPEETLGEMPAELVDYTLTINGQKLSLPTTFAKLEEMGWVFQNPEDAENWILPGSYQQNVYLINGDGQMEIGYLNPSNHTLRVEDCVICEIYVTEYSFDDSYTGEEVNTLECPLGLVLGQSSWKDVEWPKGYEKNNIFSLNYEYTQGSEQLCKFMFHTDTGVLHSLRIRNKDPQAMAALIGSAYDTQPPEYDAEALAQQLGAEMYFQAGDYRFPLGCTVSEYVNLGYTLDKAPEFVTSGKYDAVFYRCDTWNQVEVQGYNPFARALTPEHCFVGRLDSTDITSNAEKIELICTFGDQTLTIWEGMGLQELKALLDTNQISYTINDFDDLIFCFPQREDITITCFVYDNKVSWIRVDLCEALRNCLFEASQKSDVIG